MNYNQLIELKRASKFSMAEMQWDAASSSCSNSSQLGVADPLLKAGIGGGVWFHGDFLRRNQ